jgi:hypothetical protein
MALGICLLLTACQPTPIVKVITPTAWPTATQFLPPTKSPKSPQLGVTEWTWSREVDNDTTRIHVQGIVQNQSSGTIKGMQLYLVLRAADGRFLGTESTSIYQVLAPNEVYPWQINAQVPAELVTVEISNILGDWATETKIMPSEPPVAVTEWAVRHEGSATSPYLRVQGIIKNVSTQSLTQIQVHIVMRDANGRFLGVESAYISSQSLAPGDSIPWTVNSPEPADFAEASILTITWNWDKADQ